MGIEPTTFCMASRRTTTVLFPHDRLIEVGLILRKQVKTVKHISKKILKTLHNFLFDRWRSLVSGGTLLIEKD